MGGWVLMVALALMSVGSWWTVRRIWSGADVTTGPIQMIPASSKAGANAARLPIAVTFTVGWIGMAANAVATGSPNGDGPVATATALVAIVALLGSGWMWLFAW